MNIGIDIDDTISKTSEETDIWAKEYTQNMLKRKFELQNIDIFDPMWARHLYGWSIEENKEFWNLYYEKIMENVIPKEDAIDVINQLYSNNNIVIITARWDRENGIISKITEEWLKKYQINYDKLFMGQKDKRDIAKKCNIDIFIDDSYKTCKEISEIGIKTYMMNSRINRERKDENWERVFSWKDIKNKINNYKEEF